MSSAIHDHSVSDACRLRDLQLELSLKPFFNAKAETREAACRELFEQWRALARHAERVSILLWVGDGSEILEYEGDLDVAFEWARYNGSANHHLWKWPDSATTEDPDHSGIGIAAGVRDPERKGIHCHAYLYRPEPAVFTYRWLRELVFDLKRLGQEILDRPILVGEAFDIGPEFARSRFKYEWHREILSDGPVFKEQFISCEAMLEADQRRYAAFPDGIPAGTSIGRFLGAQTRRLFDDCGHDFLWLSNGFGFALEPWAMVGTVFDGAAFHPDRVAGTSERILGFWRDLRSGLGEETVIRCRGTNLATGIDLGSDASPLRRIYDEIPNLEAPVNSPWAALDGDFGLELAGWMSHIATRPGDGFRFRFYLHDPWWLNSPWFDRYGRLPHDLYLPLSVSRLQPDGTAEVARDLAFLSVNDSDGNMPVAVSNEVTAFYLRAREKAPDELGSLVWVYPLNEYESLTVGSGRPDRPFHADALMGAIINAGVPLNSVAEAEILGEALRAQPTLIDGRLFMAPVPAPGGRYESVIRALLDAGAHVLLYGPLFEDSFLWRELGLDDGEALQGDFRLTGSDSASPSMIRHLGFLSAGGWAEVRGEAQGADPLVLVEGEQAGERRVALTVCERSQRGRIGWLRGSLATGEFDPARPAPIRGPILRPLADRSFVPYGALARTALLAFGWSLKSIPMAEMSHGPYLTAHYHRNAFILSGYHRNEHSRQSIRLPLGAPILVGRQNRIEEGATLITGEVAWQYEVRVFVSGMVTGEVGCRELPPLMQGVRRRLLVSGLERAVVRILPDPVFLASVRLLREPKFPYFLGETIEPRPERHEGRLVITAHDVSGELLVEW